MATAAAVIRKGGGGRVIDYVAVGSAIYLMTAYPKNEADDLSPEQRKRILAVIEGLKGERELAVDAQRCLRC